MRDSLQRRLSRAILVFGIRIAPEHAAQWAQAMLGELREVKGEWAALFWAVGGTSVLVKHALVALVFPARHAPALLPNGGLFAKEGPMRKTILSVIGACVAVSLLFLLAPTLRQGLGVSVEQWRSMSQVGVWPPQTTPALKALERQAEKKHDAEALALAAVLFAEEAWDGTESAKLADEAVRLDPKLTWIYSMARPGPNTTEKWIQKLEQWDPQNALPYLMEAKNLDVAVWESGKALRNKNEKSPAWKNALEAAFQSPKLDDYQDRMRELDRKISARYDLRNPYQVIEAADDSGFAGFATSDANDYGESLLESGQRLEASGNLTGAHEKYLEVIRFGEVTKNASWWWLLGRSTLQNAYEKAGELAQRQGGKGQAELYSYLAGDFTRERDKQLAQWRQEWQWPGNAVSLWNANVMKVSGLLLPLSVGLLLICALTILAQNRSLRMNSLCVSRGIVALGLGGAIGLLLSTALLYVSYWPYAAILRQFISTGNYSRLSELGWFLAYTQVPLGFHPATPGYVFNFWLVVIVLCVVALLVIAVRHLHVRPRAKVTT